MLDALAAGGGFPGVLPKSLRKSSSCSTIYIGMFIFCSICKYHLFIIHQFVLVLVRNFVNFIKYADLNILSSDDSTISQPNLKNTIKCISLAIYYHIANRKNRGHERLMEIFEERLHPITVFFLTF